ncbi:hypothetical protein AAP_00754 [Ascosphaera apis ARSEF 7405]|uniref:FAR1 domain-containing protein n=1 Tax=Ascosphaera apis ARSEF 7405 TaxID=392613 RepID=A0A168CX41_9EURO|nr:hypothetical protein AAP_00754 [Ascosphaera apis ARSEF 7405]
MSFQSSTEQYGSSSSIVWEDALSSPINTSPRREAPSSPVPQTLAPAQVSSPVDDGSRKPDDISVCDGYSFTSLKQGEMEIADAAEEADFAIVRRRTRKPNITIPEGYKYLDVECYMSRSNPSRPTNGSRQAVSSRCGCPWSAVFSYRDGIWVFKIKNSSHNHARQKGSEIPANRRRHRDVIVKTRAEL